MPSLSPSNVAPAPGARSTQDRDDALAAYLRRLRARPPVVAVEESALTQDLLAGGPVAAAARRKLIEAHLPFVVELAEHAATRGLPLADLVQEGNLALVEAAARFDPRRGVRFRTAAGWRIRRALARAAARLGPLLPAGRPGRGMLPRYRKPATTSIPPVATKSAPETRRWSTASCSTTRASTSPKTRPVSRSADAAPTGSQRSASSARP